MIRQSLVEERLSALHHRTLQSPGDNDGDMSRSTARPRLPAPAGSRIVIKKNSTLLTSADDMINPSPPSSPSSPPPAPTVDPRARVELLERNLRYVQRQHETTLKDLHQEICRLQEENRDLHFQMINLRPGSKGNEKKTKKDEIVPSISQLTELTQKEPVLESINDESDEKRLQEVQRLHFEEQIIELRTRLIESEEKNRYLTRTIDQLHQVSSQQTSSLDAGPVLLPDPKPLLTASLDVSQETQPGHQESTPVYDVDFQHLLAVAHEKQRQQLQEIARLRAVLREVLLAERLSSTSKLLIRDCLATSTIGDLPGAKTNTPITISFPIGHSHPRLVASSSTGGKGATYRHELHIRRLNLSPPQLNSSRTLGQTRSSDQRLVLPPIQASGNTPSTQDPMGSNTVLNTSVSPTNPHPQQGKFGETPVARRERRTQELQRTRLTRNLYH